jgi:hypothetical protein
MSIVHGTAGTVCMIAGFACLSLATIRFLWLSGPKGKK